MGKLTDYIYIHDLLKEIKSHAKSIQAFVEDRRLTLDLPEIIRDDLKSTKDSADKISSYCAELLEFLEQEDIYKITCRKCKDIFESFDNDVDDICIACQLDERD